MTSNVSNTPVKGRPKKKGFKGTPKKLKLDTTNLDNSKNIVSTFNINPDINAKVLLYQGDITKVQVHAIVNPANE